MFLFYFTNYMSIENCTSYEATVIYDTKQPPDFYDYGENSIKLFIDVKSFFIFCCVLYWFLLSVCCV